MTRGSRYRRVGRCFWVLLALLPVQWAKTSFADEDKTATHTNSPYAQSVVDLSRAFLDSLSQELRNSTLFSFEDPRRITGRDTHHTPSFCAVLAWCRPWGARYCDLSFKQKVALNRLLSTALGTSGYQMVLSIWNRNRVIGELENIADTKLVGEAANQCPNTIVGSVFDIPPHCLSNGDQLDTYVGIAGAWPPDTAGDYKLDWQLQSPPGLEGRRKQFCEYSVAIFGEPGSELWALRLEGHHLTINLTFERDNTGNYRVDATPLFLGAFPVRLPPSPSASDIEMTLSWQEGQSALSAPAVHTEGFLAHLPDETRQRSWSDQWTRSQVAPLSQNTPPPWLVTSLKPSPDIIPDTVKLKADGLSLEAKWHLEQLLGIHFQTMPTEVGDRYRHYLRDLLEDGGEIELLWSGDTPPDAKRNLFLHLRVGSLLYELVSDNQWSVSHPEVKEANHIHTMLRDLDFRWDFDAGRDVHHHHHHHRHHHHHHHHPTTTE